MCDFMSMSLSFVKQLVNQCAHMLAKAEGYMSSMSDAMEWIVHPRPWFIMHLVMTLI